MNIKKIIIICSISILIIAGLFCLYYFVLLRPTITLIGDKVMLVSLNSKFTDPGFITDKKTGEKKEIKVIGKVDTTKLGEYDIIYSVEEHNHTVKIKRIVKVIDNTPPVITLTGGENVALCPGGTYQELGYSAIDDYDGDITSKVKVKVSNDNIIYKAKDSSNNEALITRTLVYEDKTAPIITLKGSQTVTLIIGSKYYESGYTATDNCDTDINNKVQIIGSVNYNALGTYYISYNVKDLYGNSTTVTRTIYVKNPPAPKNSTVYLTFDDGPSPLTATILDILKDEGVPATFFVINRSDSYNYLIAREYNEGHSVGLHCYTHSYGTVYASVDAYFNDLSMISNKVYGIIGVEPKIIRFPGGSSNTVSKFNPGIMTTLTKEVMNRGYVYFDWNVGSTDTIDISSTQVYNNVISQIGNYSTYVVLMHDTDGNWKTANALRNIIRTLKSNGYNFGRITTSTPQIKHRVAN